MKTPSHNAFYLLVFFSAISLFTTASALETTPRVLGTSLPVVHEYRAGDPVIHVFLHREQYKWSASLTGDLKDPSYELVQIRKDRWTYNLLTSKPIPNPKLCLAKMKDRAIFGYLECNSAFYSTNVGSTTVSTVLRGVFTLGIGTVSDAAAGNSAFSVSYDQNSFEQAIAESNALQLAKDTIQYHEYQTNFNTARTVAHWDAFIDKYGEKFDPDNLVVVARQRLAEAIEVDLANRHMLYVLEFEGANSVEAIETFILKYAQDDKDKLIPKAKEKLKIARREQAAEKIHARKLEEEKRIVEAQRHKKIEVWQNTLRAGEETACGTVIEVKPPMIRVALRSQTKRYENDIWVRKTDLLPTGSECAQDILPAKLIDSRTEVDTPAHDSQGRRLIRGPLHGGTYNNVHIVSDSVGIEGSLVYVTNSVIEAPVCIRTPGQHTVISGNTLNCNLCVEFTSGVIIDNRLTDNSCSGRGTNRPDIFNW